MEYAAWILECSLSCERTKVDSILVFPDDLGGHQHHGPASVWQLREFQVLECDHDARRGAGFLCQLAHAEQKRPLGILTTLAALQSDLRYVGPLPQDCGCLAQHSPMVGCNTDQHFFSSMSPTLGPLFWKRIWKARAEEKFPLRDGKSAVHFSPSSQCPSLASGVDSRQRLFKLWQSRGLKRESLSQWAEAKELSAYMASIGKLLSSTSLPLSSSFSCGTWSLDSRGFLVENAAAGSPPSSLLSSTATGILQGDVGTGTPLRTRSRSTRTLKRPLASLKQRRDGNVAPRPLFPSAAVDTASDDGVRSDS